MNYPVWYLPEIGGGLLIACIAILHVFVSHFAVGGGLYLIYAEKKALRQNSRAMLEFVRNHARFFLLVTMVFGSITGVGIWFIIALVNPAATSFLIHNFVFGWAAEWVFFVVEIVAAFVYYYRFEAMDSDTHLKVGWIYFIAAWLSLLLINGIISVMLTPGHWGDDFDFWKGFFNPGFWPSLVFRTCLALMMAAAYGYVSATFTRENEVRLVMTRFSAGWALGAFLAAIPAGFWMLHSLPVAAQALVFGKSPTISMLIPWFAAGSGIFVLISLVAGIIRPSLNLKPVAGAALVAALLIIGGFEWVREAARRPYVLNEVMYSNGIMKSEVDEINANGFLQSAIWTESREVNGANVTDAGRELFINQCYACHTVQGVNNDIVAATKRMSFGAMDKYLEKMHDNRYFMPPFIGAESERKALAAYIVGTLNGKDIAADTSTFAKVEPGETVFDEHCSSCHSIDELRLSLSGRTTDDILATLKTLNTIADEMKPFSGTGEQAKQLVSYLGPPAGGAETADNQAQTPGQTLFDENCAACHEPEELSGRFSGMQITGIVKTLATLDQISTEMQPFSGSDEEAATLADFLAALKNENGAPTVTAVNGAEVFKAHCNVCHAESDMAKKMVGRSKDEIFDLLGRLNTLQKAMPPFRGTADEREALAGYLSTMNKGGK